MVALLRVGEWLVSLSAALIFFAVLPARDETKIATDIVVAVFVLTGGWRCLEMSVVLLVDWSCPLFML